MDQPVPLRRYIVRFTIFYLILYVPGNVITTALASPLVVLLVPLAAAIPVALRFIRDQGRAPTTTEEVRLAAASLGAVFAVAIGLSLSGITFTVAFGAVADAVEELGRLEQMFLTPSGLGEVAVFSVVLFLLFRFCYGFISRHFLAP